MVVSRVTLRRGDVGQILSAVVSRDEGASGMDFGKSSGAVEDFGP
jgi:hypothetical protein